MQDEKEIKKSIKDLEAHLAFLADEATKKAAELSSLYRQVETTASDIERHNNILKELKVKVSDSEKILQQQRTEISKNNLEISGHQDVLRTVLAENEKQKKTSLKDLQKVNQWIIDAKTDQEKLETILNQINSAINDKKDTIDHLLEKQKELDEIREHVSKLRATVEQLKVEKQQIMQDQLDIIDDVTSKTTELEERATTAEARLREATEIYDRKMKDLAIYEYRVVKEYETAFPGRKVKLV